MILDDYQQVATSYADWSALHDVEVAVVGEHLTDDDQLAQVLDGAEIVVVMRERTPLTRALLERLPDLRLVVTSGMRNASIDLAACRERGIPVCGTASSQTPPVELTWALILGLCRHLRPEASTFGERPPHLWQTTVGTDLAGATLGLLGLGRIGTRVAAVARAFDMDVAAWSPHLTEERAAAAGARLVDRHTLFAESDVVSLHLVLSAATRGIVGAAEIGAMKRAAYLVNTSRSGLVDMAVLVAVLRDERIAGAGLDVFDTEPLPLGDPLRGLDTVLCTPHLGYVTHGNYRRFFTEAVEDIAAWQAGEPVRVLS